MPSNNNPTCKLGVLFKALFAALAILSALPFVAQLIAVSAIQGIGRRLKHYVPNPRARAIIGAAMLALFFIGLFMLGRLWGSGRY